MTVVRVVVRFSPLASVRTAWNMNPVLPNVNVWSSSLAERKPLRAGLKPEPGGGSTDHCMLLPGEVQVNETVCPGHATLTLDTRVASETVKSFSEIKHLIHVDLPSSDLDS